MKKTALIADLALLSACAAPNTNVLDPGMSKEQVTGILGVPETRSFKGNDEAWQYQGVVGFGQCKYSTVWFSNGVVIAVTSRSGASAGGCGLGSREVDWGQMPKPSIDINIKQGGATK
jgi:hypothetical protein